MKELHWSELLNFRVFQETVQAILEIKFSNIISEILIEERRFLFEGGSTTEMEVKPQNDSASSKASLFYRLPSQRYKRVSKVLYQTCFVVCNYHFLT